METTQTFQPESIVVTVDNELDLNYYDQVYDDKRKEALAAVRADLINNLCSMPARIGRAVVYLMARVVETAN